MEVTRYENGIKLPKLPVKMLATIAAVEGALNFIERNVDFNVSLSKDRSQFTITFADWTGDFNTRALSLPEGCKFDGIRVGQKKGHKVISLDYKLSKEDQNRLIKESGIYSDSDYDKAALNWMQSRPRRNDYNPNYRNSRESNSIIFTSAGDDDRVTKILHDFIEARLLEDNISSSNRIGYDRDTVYIEIGVRNQSDVDKVKNIFRRMFIIKSSSVTKGDYEYILTLEL
jgi:hypothetical protein